MKKILIPALFLPSAALAHPGHFGDNLFMTGLMHPLSGTDHILAMIAVGLWAAGLGGRAVWALPVSFVAAMVLGGVMGASGLTIPMTEPMILGSVIILGAALALALRLPMPIMLAMVGLFGAAHGFAHGVEGPSSGLAIYALGFAGATVALHLLGMGIGRIATALMMRGAGLAVMAGGLVLAMA